MRVPALLMMTIASTCCSNAHRISLRANRTDKPASVTSEVVNANIPEGQISPREKIMLAIWGETGADGLWTGFKKIRRDSGLNAANYPQVLYDQQLLTQPLFEYAARKNNLDVVNDIVELCLLALNTLKSQSTYRYFDAGGYKTLPLPQSRRMWIDSEGTEIVLDSAQFLGYVARIIGKLIDVPTDKRSAGMNRFLDEFPSIAVEHFERWSTDRIFEVSGWNCGPMGRYNLQEFIQAKINHQLGNRFSYCNWLSDGEMWMAVGMAELLAAQEKSDKVSLTATQISLFSSVISLFMTLLVQRIHETALQDFAGNDVVGATLDPGVWHDHPEFSYVGNEGSTYPQTKSLPVLSISEDISHARRLVQLFDSLVPYVKRLGITLPIEDVARKFANQILYHVFTGDFRKPLFRNFLDGSNGWYRVGYAVGNGFGYAPYSLSYEWLASGYCTWKKYQPGIEQLCDAVWNMATSSDPEVIEHRRHYFEEGHYYNFKPRPMNVFDLSSSYDLMLFIAAVET